MKTAKRTLSILFALLMLASCLAIGTSASGSNVLSHNEWNSYWETVRNDNTLISLSPGSDTTQLNFCWHSDSTADNGVVRISKDPQMTSFKEFVGKSSIDKSSTDKPDAQKVYKVTVTGLEPNTVYYYTYGSNGNFSKPFKYRTLSTEQFKILYISDIQICSDTEDGREEAYAWQKTLGTALDQNEDISFIVSAGDQTHHGDRANEWAAALSPLALRSYPMAMTVGNHDCFGNLKTTYPFYVNHPNEYRGTTPAYVGRNYWFRYGDVLFIVYNTQSYNLYDLYQFTLDAVAKNPDATWRIATFHHDIYGPGKHASDDNTEMLRAIYSSILEKFEIDACLTGHEHIYGRSYFMKDTKPVKEQKRNENGAFVDPEGIVYFTAASASNRNRIDEENYTLKEYDYEWLDFQYISQEACYSTIEFTKNSFTLKTYGVDSKKLIDECKIVKTDTSYSPVDPNYKGMDTDMLQRYLGKWYVIIQIAIEVARYVVKITSVVAPVIAKIVIKIIKALIPVIINMF